MEVVILHTEDCPNWVEAGGRLRDALRQLGLLNQATVSSTLLATPEDAALVPFAGSPTIVVDGIDLFPPPETTSDLACRVYFSGGRLAGLPTTEDITTALQLRSPDGNEG